MMANKKLARDTLAVEIEGEVHHAVQTRGAAAGVRVLQANVRAGFLVAAAAYLTPTPDLRLRDYVTDRVDSD